MTQEDKQKLAERIAEKAMSAKNVTYAFVLQAVHEALNARDEEVEELKLSHAVAERTNRELYLLCVERKGQIDADGVLIRNLRTKLEQLKAELAKAKNPWVSVEERLPEITNQSLGESDFVFVHAVNKDTGAEWIELPAKYNERFHDWQTNDFTWIRKRSGVVTHWMPIPKGGEE